MNKNIQCSNLIDIDAHIKVIYIDSSRIKLLRLSPKSSHIYKNILIIKNTYVIKQLKFQINSQHSNMLSIII